jgi:hypothetical protein
MYIKGQGKTTRVISVPNSSALTGLQNFDRVTATRVRPEIISLNRNSYPLWYDV